MEGIYAPVMALCELFAIAATGLFAGYLTVIAIKTVSAFLRRLDRRANVLAGAVGDLAGVAAAWPFECAIDWTDRCAADAAEWRTLRKTWREEFRQSMSWKAFRRQLAEGPEKDKFAKALDVFGLMEPFSRSDLDVRFKRIISLAHPDKGGSEYLGRIVNEARDLILKHKGWKK
jgi:hypothetical protein